MIEKIKNLLFKQKNNPVLIFSKRANKEIKSHLSKIDPSSVLILSVQSDKWRERKILTGFDKPRKNSKIENVDGIPIEFRGKSKEILEGSGVDWSEEGNILIYPQIDLHSEETPNPHIIAFISNRQFISENSLIHGEAWDRNDDKYMPGLVESLFKRKYIESIYIFKNRIQLEVSPENSWKNYEEEVAAVLLDYFEGLPDPIHLVDVL